MPSVSDLDTLAQQRTRRALIGAGVIIVILVAIVALLLSGSGPAPAPSPPPPVGAGTAPPALAPPPPPASASPPASDGYVPPQRWTALPNGTLLLKRTYRVGFPRTPQGAAAAAAAMFQSVWHLDPARATGAVQVYFAPADQNSFRAHAVTNTRWMRQQIGLSPEGELPPDASVAVQVTGVQWRIVDASNVLVSVNMTLDLLAGVGAPLHTLPAASTAHLRWHPNVRGGDWLVVQDSSQQMPRPEHAELGTAAFNAAGWLGIRPGG
ncbi:hypothetical protein GCM10010156_66470 [Planobispora rosea]|uniref:Uncharacterized protein n=1 Tax=Planobispora rosea TaxID=35762 RepID=A0A8J3WG04_PLARO|nr:hypothetical protein [Planobispora rosea]GGS99041.1 hypothetical protein GCM10010156_66470 [Planobispora rosea]GIH88010.1 hypothetical protein Pro02_64180 [Planobispora rosea]